MENSVRIEKHFKYVRADRFVIGLGCIVLAAIATLMLAFTSISVVVKAIAIFVLTFTICSFMEWFVHIFVCHIPYKGLEFIFNPHHLGHHKIRNEGIAAYPEQSLVRRSTIQFVSQNIIGFLVITTPLYLIGIETSLLIVNVVAVILYSSLVIVFHEGYHYAIWFPYKKAKIVRFLKKTHDIHHNDISINYNVFCPIAGIIFGTFRAK